MGGAASASSSGATTSAASTSSSSGTCATDTCPLSTGLKHACEQRFALGVNYAWRNFGTDFGGLAAWGQKGISATPSGYDTDLAQMHANGVSVVRWWVFPDFRGDGITFDANGDPSGLSAEVAADVDEALALAEKNDLYLVLTIFSFDAFKPDAMNSGVLVRSIAPMVASSTRLAKVMSNVVTPLAKAAAASSHVGHLLGWDVVNEPEWAVSAVGTPGVQDFTPNTMLTTVTLAQMKTFINDGLSTLATETPTALKSVGWAANKWSWAFTDVTGIDFNQPHIYGWVDQYWPYTEMPSALGYPAKPTVFGEFTLASMPFASGNDNATYAQILGTWWTNGYAGAWGWSFADQSANLPLVKAFATAKGCPAGF
jgi:hypothetical protein